MKDFYVIGYEYKSAMGATIRKAVICETAEEYKRISNRIKEIGYKLLEFDEVISSKLIK